METIAFGDTVRDADHLVVKPGEYLPLLWVVFAAIIGVSLLCGAAAVGVNDINQAAQAGTPPVGVVDFFVANINTVIVETVEAFSNIVSAPTFTPTATMPDTPTPLTPSVTATRTRRPTVTAINRTSAPDDTRTPTRRPTATFTATITPSSTSTTTFTATFTPTYTATKTPSSTASATDLPTNTPTPTPSNTPEPTNTPIPTDTPMPTNTNTPIPTDTVLAPDL